MKKVKILLLGASCWVFPQILTAQGGGAGNGWTPGGFLGWSTPSNNQQPLHIALNAMTRMHFNGARVWNDLAISVQDFAPATLTWYQTNYSAYNMGILGSQNNPNHYIGLGDNNGSNIFSPRTRLHIQGSMVSGGTNVGPGTGYRPWMQTGTYMNEFSNHMYVGMFKRSDEVSSDAVVNWGDDPYIGVGSTPNRLRINFTPTLSQLPASGASTQDKDREVMSFWPTRIPGSSANTTENIGVGDFINFVAGGPKRHMHFHNAFANNDFIQFTNTSTTGGNNPTVTSGFHVGMNVTTAQLLQYENDHIIAYTNVAGGASERMRITRVGAPGVSATGATTNFTRIGLPINPALAVTNPLSLLHLGGNAVNVTDGWRPWMEQGIYNNKNADHVFIGLKTDPSSANKNDAVIGWGAFNATPSSTGPDNLRFIITAFQAVTPPPGGNGETGVHGQEVARFTPNCPTCPINKPSFGVGDFAPSGPNPPPGANYIGATLDIDGDARIRTVPNDNSLTQVLVIDPADKNRIHWRDASTLTGSGTLGNQCGLIPATNPLTTSWEIPTNGFNFRFADPTTSLNDDQNFVGIGSGCIPRGKLEVFRDQTSNTKPVVVGAFIENSDVANSFPFAQIAEGTYSIANGQNKGNYGIHSEATTATSNYGVSGRAMGVYTSGASNFANYGVEGIASDAQVNTGVKGTAFSNISSSTINNYGGSFGAANSTTGGTAIQNISVIASTDNGGTVTHNLGVLGYAINQLSSTTTNNVGVAGVAQNNGTVTNDIGVYGEGTYAAYFAGPTISGGAISFSDRKIKDDVKTIDNGLELLQKLNPVTYNYKSVEYPELHLSNKLQYGFIAQEVEAVIPELVSQVNKPEMLDKEGKLISKAVELKGINYDGLIPVLAKSIQEQQGQIEDLKKELAELKDMIRAGSSSTNSQNVVSIELANTNIIVLNQNVPNPFAEQTAITYNLTEGVQKAQMLFYDASGKLIKSAELPTTSGKGQLNVFANDLSTGAYTYTLVVDGRIIDTKKMIKE